MQHYSSLGKLDSIDLSRFNNLEFKSPFDSGVLFMPDMRDAVVKHVCPFCFRKLYEMRDKPLMFCKNKTHKRFIISKSKLVNR